MANINKIRISGTSYDIQDSNAPKVVELTQAQYDALVDKDPNVFYIITDASQVDLSQYWTSAQTNSAITEAVSGKADSSSVYLKSETSGATEISTALNDKLDVTAYTPTDLSNYYTTAQTNTKISQAVSGKTNQSDFTAHTANTTVHVTAEDKTNWNNKSDFSGDYNDLTNKLSAGTNITIVDNVISAEGGGGGKAIEAGRGISIATGATADTVSFNLPISAGTNNLDNITCCGSNTTSGQYAVSFGNGNTTKGSASLTFGRNCSTNNPDNVAGGFGVTTKGNQASSFGQYTKTENEAEHSVGRYNVSNKANTTWGNSGNTLFSVGNGTADNARHNAFEIRQDGSIYISSGGTGIKLQDHLGGGGASYSAGTGIDITNDVISVTGMVDTTTYSTYTAATDTALSNKQTTLTAGTGISIVDNVISATGGGGGGNVNVVELTQAQYDALTTIDPDAIYVITDAQGGDLSQYMTSAQTTSAITQATSDKVSTSAITTSITSSSTDAQIPSAKAVYDIVGDIETLLSQI